MNNKLSYHEVDKEVLNNLIRIETQEYNCCSILTLDRTVHK